MKLDEFLRQVDLHGSLIEDIKYYSNEGRLVIKIDLCNWKQSGYKDIEPETLLGKLVFIEVKSYIIEPNLVLFDSDEILQSEIFYPSSDCIDLGLKITLRGSNDIKVIYIVANDVQWQLE